MGERAHLPAVSVIIPTYNRAGLVARAVESALREVEPGDEVIVADDGSTDDTAQVLARFGGRIRHLRFANGGPGAARNRAVREARAPLIAFLDSDDEWMPGKLAVQRALMHARPDLVMSFTDIANRNRAGKEYRWALAYWHKDPRGWDEILGPAVPLASLADPPPAGADVAVHAGDLYATQLRGTYVVASTVMVRRDRAGEPPWFPEDIRIYEDWEGFARLARRGPVAYIARELAWYHGHDGPRLSAEARARRIETRIRVLERVWAADPAFMQAHGDRVRARLAEEHRRLATALLEQGRAAEARRALRRASDVSLAHRVLASLPGGLAAGLLRVARRLRGGRAQSLAMAGNRA